MATGTSLVARYQSRRQLGEAFLETSVAEAYRFRPPYSEAVIGLLLRLLGDGPRRVLDAGCGPGKLALALAPHVDHVDAVDPSEAMLAVARSQANKGGPPVRWVQSKMEDAPLAGPYGLVVAGASIHWFDLDVVLPRLCQHTHPGARLALVYGDEAHQAPWRTDELELFMDLSERRTGSRPNAVKETPRRFLEHPRFKHETTRDLEPFGFEQSVDDYVACQRSRASLSRETLGPELSGVLERDLRALLEPHAVDGRLRFDVQFQIEWGTLA